MADLKYRVDVDTKTAQNNLSAFKRTLAGVGTALAALGVGKAIKSFIDVGSSVENLGLRFKFLFGSAEEGAKAFDVLTKFAAKVPFSLQEIEKASGNLAVVSEDADDLANLLKITGNVAAVTGLDFKTTGEQIQRAFAGGIASADIFREKGVRSMLGFEEGAKVSIEETIKRFQEVFGEGGKFGNATDEFANTLAGTVSMLQDKLFSFQKSVAEGFFNELKSQLGDLDQFFKDSGSTIEVYAEQIGKGLVAAIQGVAAVAKFLVENIDAVKAAFVGLAIAKITGAFIQLTLAIRNTAAAMGILNVVVGKNPFVKIATGLLAAGGALAYYFGKTKEAKKEQLDYNKTLKDYQKFLDAGGDHETKQTNQDKNTKKAKKDSTTIKQLAKDIQKDFDKMKRELNLDRELIGLDGFEKELKQIQIQEQKTMEATIERIKAAGKDLPGQDDLIKKVKEQTDIIIEEKQKQAQAQKELDESIVFGIRGAMKEYVENVRNYGEQARRAFEKVTRSMEDAIVKFAKTGKFSFRDLINDMLETLLRSRIQELFSRVFDRIIPVLDQMSGVERNKKLSYVGMLGNGGLIGKGQYGIAGESGPEYVTGPAQVTPMSDTNVVYNINAVDARSFQQLLASDPSFLFAVTEQGRKTVPEFRR